MHYSYDLRSDHHGTIRKQSFLIEWCSCGTVNI